MDRELHRIVRQQRTTAQDDEKRQMLLRRFTSMLVRKFPGVALQPFGSYVSVFHTAISDIDISLEVSRSSQWYDPKVGHTVPGELVLTALGFSAKKKNGDES